MEETGSSPNNETHTVNMQHVIITLADGRRGVFMGPELIKEVEMKLGMVPQLSSVDFEPPRAVSMPIPRDIAKQEEASADTKISETTGQAGTESSGSVGETA